MHMAMTGLFRAKWSDAVHKEWISNLLLNRPDLTLDKLERTRMLMDRHAIDALIKGYEDLIPGLHLPDPNDGHVLAAAIRGKADVIITMNLKHFPAEITEPLDIEAQHPDEFILHLLGMAPGVVAAAAQTHRLSMKNPSRSVAEYLETIERQGLTQTVSVLREYM